jgi:hypothetical protein
LWTAAGTTVAFGYSLVLSILGAAFVWYVYPRKGTYFCGTGRTR